MHPTMAILTTKLGTLLKKKKGQSMVVQVRMKLCSFWYANLRNFGNS